MDIILRNNYDNYGYSFLKTDLGLFVVGDLQSTTMNSHPTYLLFSVVVSGFNSVKIPNKSPNRKGKLLKIWKNNKKILINSEILCNFAA